MTKACIVVDSAYLNNRLFDMSDKTLNRDNCLYGFYLLKENLRGRGIDLCTQDLVRPRDAGLVIYNEMPLLADLAHVSAKKILIIFETEVIRPDNWNTELHDLFDKIFTWNDEFVDNEKYLKINFPNHIPEDFEQYAFRKREGLCVMIAGNKQSTHNLELYSERLRMIKWFERHHVESFHLYGRGWDTATQPRIVRALIRRGLIPKAWLGKRASYRGSVESKLDTLSQFKFAICYENVKEKLGYITEKIFDCFFAGCVPVYWGAPNIEDYIPASCFIQREDFKRDRDLYDYIAHMSERERTTYVENGVEFLKSDAAKPFTDSFFAEKVASQASALLSLS